MHKKRKKQMSEEESNLSIEVIKFGEARWIQKIVEGELSFSCAGAFINQAKKTGNTIQGDLLEAVFARLLKTNPKIQEMREKLGNDLEEIPDGDYIFLRRKSAKRIPIFCIFSLKKKNFISKKPGNQNIEFSFDKRLYDGFANKNIKNTVPNSHKFTMAYFITEKFINRIKLRSGHQELRSKIQFNIDAVAGFSAIPEEEFLAIKSANVRYENFHEGEFFSEPTDNYDELFVKSDEYEYQAEVRICIRNIKLSSYSDRYTVKIEKFKDGEYKIIPNEVIIKGNGNFVKINTP